MNPYSYFPRPTRFLGVIDYAGYRLKCHAITVDGQWPDQVDWQPAITTLCTELPQPARSDVRPGVGFLILHHGRGADYLVLGWWDNGNELPLRLRIREHGRADWRAAQAHESICVWDIELIAAERDAYVATVLGGRGIAAVEDYLAAPPLR